MPLFSLPSFNSMLQAVARTTLPAASSNGSSVDVAATTLGAQIVQPFSAPELSWQYTGVLTTTAQTAMRTARSAGVRNYLTDVSFQNTSATATTITIQDGSTAIAQFNAPASMAVPAWVGFQTPLRGTAATALNVVCGTTAANVLVNAQGFEAP